MIQKLKICYFHQTVLI